MCRAAVWQSITTCSSCAAWHITLPSTLESFFKTLKRELVRDRSYKTREDAKQEVFKYIELYYNTQRLHSKNGCKAPCELGREVA